MKVNFSQTKIKITKPNIKKKCDQVSIRGETV